MKKSDIITMLFQGAVPSDPHQEKALAFAPSNIALCKYWGKRDTELNLPLTSSLSIALPDKGAMTSLSVIDKKHDVISLNGKEMPIDSMFVRRASEFLDLFRPYNPWHVHIDINSSVPVAAGLASSACGFASLVLALNELFNWKLSKQNLSILARLGSGSASRSLWNGFVEWHAGMQNDGMDSYATPLTNEWPQLRVGILSISENEKSISSRDAMQRTVNSSVLYSSWAKKVTQDLPMLKQAIQSKNFSLLGGTAESNALSMHATMLSSWPPICYYLPETIAAMHKIWDMREQGTEVYFTQDAGPNLKLLFQAADTEIVKNVFPEIEVVKVFE